MKFILSSCDFSNDCSKQFILSHLPASIELCRVLFIPNEKATSKKIQTGKYHKRLQAYGFAPENIYVFDENHASDYVSLAIDVLYVSGGNTFLTLQKLRASGFDTALLRYIHHGVTYIGGSAGAHLVTKDLRHIALYDDPPADLTDFSGLGLIDELLICHYTEERREHYEQLCRDTHAKIVKLSNEDSVWIEK